MNLPETERAFVDPRKVRDYLLSPVHPVGRFKAAVFRTLGYSREDWAQLQTDLLGIGRSGEAQMTESADFGQKYEVRGVLTGPSGNTLAVITAWIVRSGEDFPRFVTAYPRE